MGSQSSDVRQSKTIQNVWWYIAIGLAETIGTAMLVFMGCTSAVPGLTATPPSHLQICITFGITVAIIIQTFGHVSGAHLNPAVSVAACILRMIPVPIAIFYTIAQMIGGLLGYATILFLTPSDKLYHEGSNMNISHGFCTTVPNPKVTILQALFAEHFATGILIFLCCGVWDRRNATKHDSVPLKFGLAITALALAFGSHSGASMNPARSFAPALFTGVWDSHWIYWVGPLTAAFSVAFFYRYVFDRNPPEPEPDQSDVPLNQASSKVRTSYDKTSNEGLSSV